MNASPLRQFVLAAALWLPAMFFLWFLLQSAVVYLPVRISAMLLTTWMPDVFAQMQQDYHHLLFAYVADVSGVVGLPGERLLVEEQRINVLVFCYGLPLLFGLVMATPLNWRRTFLQMSVGLAVLSLVAAFGTAGEALKTVMFGVGPAIQVAVQTMDYAPLAAAAAATAAQHMQAALAAHGLGPDLVALWAQFGYLVLPAVTPVVLWILLNRRFVEDLVQWDGEPVESSAGRSIAASGQQQTEDERG